MQVTSTQNDLIEHYRPTCPSPHCKAQYQELADLLLETLRSPQVTALEYAGEYRLNPESNYTRPVYEIVHQDGRTLRLAFTGLSTLQVFSPRNRSTHCCPGELARRMQDFIST